MESARRGKQKHNQMRQMWNSSSEIIGSFLWDIFYQYPKNKMWKGKQEFWITCTYEADLAEAGVAEENQLIASSATAVWIAVGHWLCLQLKVMLQVCFCWGVTPPSLPLHL